MPDIFEGLSSGLESPGLHAAEVIPSDSSDLAVFSRALFVGNGGDLRITTSGGDTVTLRNVPSGVVPLRIARVHATGTTAANIVAVW